jgi:hypothetical protein
MSEETFLELEDFKEKHGHCNVPRKCPENPELAAWVQNQRTRQRSNTISSAERTRLEEIGFVCSLTEDYWEKMFSALVDYKSVHGDCRVPQKYPEKPELGRWVSVQRRDYKANTISDDRKKRLEEIGFVWNAQDIDYWGQMFSALLIYKERYGDCNVPRSYSDQKLARWVSQQRIKRTGLDSTKRKRLEDIGFVWEPRKEEWGSMFSELHRFKIEHGHCNVPSTYSGNPKLAYWVIKQRVNYKKGKLSQDRIEKLEKLGFVWEPQKRG